jgi:hypothetical protein
MGPGKVLDPFHLPLSGAMFPVTGSSDAVFFQDLARSVQTQTAAAVAIVTRLAVRRHMVVMIQPQGRPSPRRPILAANDPPLAVFQHVLSILFVSSSPR